MDYAYKAYAEYIKKSPLTASMDVEALRLELNRFWDGVMLSVTQATADTHTRNAYRLLLQQTRSQADVLNWLDEPEIYYNTTAAARGKRKTPWCGLLALVLLAALIVWFAVPHKTHNTIYAGLIGAAVLLNCIQFFLLVKAVPTAPSAKVRTEQRIAPDKVLSGLKRLVREVDGHAESLQAILAEGNPQSEDMDLTLAQDLMRIPKNKRGPEVEAAVDRFLTHHGVEQVLFSSDKSELFMVLPSDREMTLEPALVKDGRLLKMGVACMVMEG